MFKRLMHLSLITLILTMAAFAAAFIFIPTAQAQEQILCSYAAAPRLEAGGLGQIPPGFPNLLLSHPYIGRDSSVIAHIPAGSIFNITGKVRCYNYMNLWQVDWNGQIGWSPEAGNDGQYLIVPLSRSSNCMTLTSRLSIGAVGQVLADLPNVLHSEPTMDSAISMSMWSGSFINVVDGPICSDHMTWWQVNYNGQIGWAIEGQSYGYWLAPYSILAPTPSKSSAISCPGFQPSRLRVGQSARVTPGFANRVRSSPSTSSVALGLIPAGAQFEVIGTTVCAENFAWWQVDYQGLVGWTVEGQGAEYWLEPVN